MQPPDVLRFRATLLTATRAFHTDAPLATIARHGVLLTVDAERDGWLRTVGLQAGVGWVFEEGSALGLGTLLARV